MTFDKILLERYYINKGYIFYLINLHLFLTQFSKTLEQIKNVKNAKIPHERYFAV